MQRRTLSMLAALAAALPLASQAGTMDYSFVELGYVDTELDSDRFDVDGDGFALRGSIAFAENFFAFAGYQDIGYDFDVDVTAFEVGVGGHWPLSGKMDIVGRAGIVKAEIDAPGFDDDDDGFTLGARLRGEVATRFELEGGFDYVDIDTGDDTTLVGEARYFFTEQFAGGVALRFGDDATAIGIAARMTF